MVRIITETHTYIGESGTLAFDANASFRIIQRYPLRIKRREDGTMAVALTHAHCAPGVR
jgi:hypothetical protein